MGTTPRLALPYPEVTDPPDGAGQMQDLAVALDGAVQAGEATIVVSAAVFGTVAVTFPRPFASPPQVVASLSNSYYVASVATPTATAVSITARDHRATSNTATITVRWVAVGASAS